MPQKKTKVKSFLRKGKVVRAYDRSIGARKKKSTAKKTAIGAAGVLGLTGVSYLALKGRYIRNLNASAKLLAKNSKAAPVVKKNKMMFVIGGFTARQDPRMTSPRQSILIKRLVSKDFKDQELIPFASKFDMPGDSIKLAGPQKLFRQVLSGRNPEAERLAQEIYDYAQSNPGKPINLLAYSAGTMVSTDAAYILKKAGVDIKVATFGGTNFRMVPRPQKSIHISSKNDEYYRLRFPGASVVNEVKSHSAGDYLKNKTVKQKLKDFLS